MSAIPTLWRRKPRLRTHGEMRPRNHTGRRDSRHSARSATASLKCTHYTVRELDVNCLLRPGHLDICHNGKCSCLDLLWYWDNHMKREGQPGPPPRRPGHSQPPTPWTATQALPKAMVLNQGTSLWGQWHYQETFSVVTSGCVGGPSDI